MKKIREKIILTEKEKGNGDIKIPGFFFTHLAKNSDKFDLFHSGAMAPYYGVKSIEPFYVGFNYAQINKAKNIDVTIDFGNKILLKKSIFTVNFLAQKM